MEDCNKGRTRSTMATVLSGKTRSEGSLYFECTCLKAKLKATMLSNVSMSRVASEALVYLKVLRVW